MNKRKAINKLIQKQSGFVTDCFIFDQLKFPNSQEKLNDLLKSYLSNNEFKIYCISNNEIKCFRVHYNYGYLELVETSELECENYQLYSFNELAKRFGDTKINFGMSHNISLSLSEKNVSLY